MKFRKNVGRLDRTLRLMVGLALFGIGLFLLKGDVLIMVIGLAMLGVGLIGFCPVYVPFGISTSKNK